MGASSNVYGTVANPLVTSDHADADAWARSAFGLPVHAQLHYACGWNFNLGINARIAKLAHSGTGAVDPAWEGATTRMVNVAVPAHASTTATLSSRRAARYVNGIGIRLIGTARVDAAGLGVVGASWEFGLGDDSDGLVFGQDPATGMPGILLRSSLSGAANAWLPQSQWNGERFLGVASALNPGARTLDPAKLNLFGLQYQFLGGGLLRAFIESPDTGLLVPVHTIQRAGLFTSMSMANPQLPVRAYAANGASAVAFGIHTGSAAAFHEGSPGKALTVSPMSRGTKAVVAGTETAILTVRSQAAPGGVTSRVTSRPKSLSVYADGAGNNPIRVRVIRGATSAQSTFAATPPDDSYVDVDTAATTITGGTAIFDADLGRLGPATVIPLDSLNDVLLPGESYTVTMGADATNFTGYASLTIDQEL